MTDTQAEPLSLSGDCDDDRSSRIKERVTVRLDPEVLKHFRRDGKGYQTRLNAALRAYVEAQVE